MHLSSPLLANVPGVIHGFGTREEPIPDKFAPRWAELQPKWRQVHGVASCEVRGPGQACGEVDALFTRQAGQPVGVVTADCVPMLLARRNGGAVAAIHAGWRGTRARIIWELWKNLAAAGEKPSEWVAAIGPSIGPCCYEVSPELADDFRREFGGRGASWILPRPRMLDLAAVNHSELRLIGVKDVDIIRACTKCAGGADNPLFHSFRREGGGSRQWSVIQAG